MPIGQSNRIVIDVDDIDLKRKLYAALAKKGRSLKDWFSAAAEDFVDAETNGRQLGFGAFRAAEESPRYGSAAHPHNSTQPESKR
jgi:hypothetical protein